jgi:tetratricopeptide (TPR) repeat protein
LSIATGNVAKEAVVLDGMATVHKERGNLPRARQVLNEALPLALQSGDSYAIGSTYQDMAAVAGMSGFMEEAMEKGWLAVRHYEHEQDQLTALTSLAVIFQEAGEMDAAEIAYETLARRLGPGEYRLYALSGYAHIAGLKRDRAEFERRIRVLEASGLADGPSAFRAADWIGRAKAYRALGDAPAARRCYQAAIEIAAADKLGQQLIRAEDGLKALEREIANPGGTTLQRPTGPPAIQKMGAIWEELGRMRDMSPALAGV